MQSVSKDSNTGQVTLQHIPTVNYTHNFTLKRESSNLMQEAGALQTDVYGPFYRIGAKSGWNSFEMLYVSFPELCPYIFCTISKLHISSKRTVHFYIVFSDCIGMFFLYQKWSLPKHSKYAVVKQYYINLLRLFYLPFSKQYFNKYFLRVFTIKSIKLNL